MAELFALKLEQDVVLARQLVRKATQELAFTIVDQTKMVTAVSEIARNTVVYGGGGTMHVEKLSEGTKKGLRVTFSDQGPGIVDMSLAMTDGWTSGGGLGMGLTGAKRLVNDFEINSSPGGGTKVVLTRWK